MRALYYFLFLTDLVLLHSCDDQSSDYVIIDERAGEEYFNGDYYIDEYGNEGVVGYISTQTPKMVMIVSIDEAFLQWGPMGESVCDNDTMNINVLTNPSFGLYILQSMQSKGIDRFPAMAWCNRKNGSESLAGAGSWRLPTRYELNLLFTNMKGINGMLADLDGTPIRSGSYYWTCLEDYEATGIDLYDCDPENRAVPVNSSNMPPEDKDYWLKKNQYFVRAIKYLYFRNL
jgi:hypothetical protein